jgi:hypothetical protein
MPGCAAQASSADSTESDLANGTRPWDAQAETEFSNWVAGIGEARAAGRCTTLDGCLNDKSINPLKDDGDANLDMYADCSKVPIELRAYFAVKTKRPFQYVSEILGDTPANQDPTKPVDYRYTKNNHPTAYSSLKAQKDMQAVMTRISTLVHSGFYRMSPDIDQNDTYPIDVRPGTVHPGTVYYDPNGHVLIVYRVDADGSVHMIDGHPDNSLTNTLFDNKLGQGSASQGGGFRNFRPIVLDQTSGAMSYTPNASLTDLGSSQYGHGSGYWDWVRTQLSGGQAMKPDAKFSQMLDQLCTDVKARVDAVDAGTHLATGALGDLPPNIYGADGDWESFSTPGRDQRLRASFRGLYQYVNDTLAKVNSGDPSIAWTDGASALVSRYEEQWSLAAASCNFQYTNSAGTAVTLKLDDVQQRIYDLSFDPYECAEMRWGAYPKVTGESSSCNTLDADHVQRFNDEATMRNAIDRPAAGADTPIGWGPTTQEDIDVGALLKRLGGS